jgi:hypothetical protein
MQEFFDTHWWFGAIVIPLITGIPISIYTGFLVGRIFAYQQEILKARLRVNEVMDRIHKVIKTPDVTEAEGVFQLFFMDMACALIELGHFRAARDLQFISLELQKHVLRFHAHHWAQRNGGLPVEDAIRDIHKFTFGAYDALTKDLTEIKPDIETFILGSWRPAPDNSENKVV